MKRVMRMTGLLLLAGLAVLSLSTCKPITYYLGQVYKVHGRVTVAGSEGETPIGSVEVFVGDYQYSELTNYYGDYELELAAGTWSINFHKEGYEPFSAEVTASAEEPRVRLDAELVWIAPPTPTDLTGHWDAYLTIGGQTNPPHLVYMKQTGSSLNGYGMTGTVDGPAVTVFVDGGGEFTGTIEADGTIAGSFEMMGMSGSFVMERSNFSYGSFELSGIVDLSTDFGLGERGDDKATYRLDFHVKAGALVGGLAFWNRSGLSAGTYAVVPNHDNEPGPGEVAAWFSENWAYEHPAVSGTLELSEYGTGGAAGSFTVQFEGGGYLSGSFDLDLPMIGGGVVAISDGIWYGSPVTPETAGGVIWSAGPEITWAECFIYYLDEDLEVGLYLQPWLGPLAAGTFSVPDQVSVTVNHEYEDGSGLNAEAVSGTLVITSLQEGVGVAGYFDGMSFPGGTLSGSFDVSFEMSGYE